MALRAARVARALGYWSLRACDDFLAVVTKRIADATGSGPLFPEEVRALIEPELLAARVLAPLTRAAQVASPAALPRWCVDAIRAGVGAVLENGAAEFELLYATPPPAPPAPTAPLAPAA